MSEIDYWQEGINFVDEKKYKEAIESYKKAIENGVNHPFLYSNIGSSYNDLGDFDSALIWFDIAVDKLLNLKDPHSGNPYYWTASFYYKNKIFNNKVIKIIRKALEFFPKDSNTVFLFASILLESKIVCRDSIKDAILKLSWIEVFQPNDENSKKIRKKYKKQIKNNIPELEEEKKEEIIKILDEREVQKESKNYILTGEGDISKMKIKSSTYKSLYNNVPLEINSKYMIRAFKIYLDLSESWAYDNVREFINENTISTLEVINTMIQLTDNIFEAIDKVIENGLYHNADETEEKQEDIKNELSKELRKLIFPKHEKEFIDYYTNKENSYNDYYLVYILLEENYNKYIDMIKEKLLKFKGAEIKNEIKSLEHIKDKDFINDYLLKRVSKLANEEYKEDLLNYLTKNNVELDKLNISEHRMHEFYRAFLENLNNIGDIENKIFKKLIRFAESINYIELYDDFFIYNSSKQVESFMKRYDLSILKVANWCFNAKDKGGYDYDYNYPFDEKLVLFLAKENIDDVILALNNSKSKSKSLYLSTLFNFNPEKLKPTVLKLSKDKGKAIQTALFNMFTNKEEYKEFFVELSKSKIKASRDLGEKLLNKISDSTKEEVIEVDKNINELYENLVTDSKKYTPKGKREPVSGVKLFNIATLPKLKFNNSNEELGIEVSYYMINFYARSKEIEAQPLANEAIKLFDKKSLNDFAQEIYYRWKFDAKTKWVFSLIASFAGEDFISGLGDRFVDMGESRKSVLMRKLLENFSLFKDLSIVKELETIVLRDQRAMISSVALVQLDKIEEKTKKTRNQLIDPYIYSYNVDYQKERLESILYVPHYWKFSDWKKQFIDKKFLNIFGQNLIWGVYGQARRPVRTYPKLNWTFRADENNALIDVENNEVKLNKSDKITLLHPVELNDEEYEKWKEHIEDYEIIQPLEQIALRRYYPENDNDSSCEPAKGFLIKRGVLRRAIYKAGWDKGYLLDHGDYDTYIKHLDSGYIAEIRFDGDAPSHEFFDDNEEIKLYELIFSKSKNYKLKSNISFENLPLRLYSSIYDNIQNILKKSRKE